ncbi:MAG: hypothetical protein RBT73_09800, partial [Spirochaetia bacterium]|nr:hypothetical protein [Spirochaetia bacterium]
PVIRQIPIGNHEIFPAGKIGIHEYCGTHCRDSRVFAENTALIHDNFSYGKILVRMLKNFYESSLACEAPSSIG